MCSGPGAPLPAALIGLRRSPADPSARLPPPEPGLQQSTRSAQARSRREATYVAKLGGGARVQSRRKAESVVKLKQEGAGREAQCALSGREGGGGSKGLKRAPSQLKGERREARGCCKLGDRGDKSPDARQVRALLLHALPLAGRWMRRARAPQHIQAAYGRRHMQRYVCLPLSAQRLLVA